MRSQMIHRAATIGIHAETLRSAICGLFRNDFDSLSSTFICGFGNQQRNAIGNCRTRNNEMGRRRELSQVHRTHPQLSPGNSVRMVAAFRHVPPACDSISSRKATYRHQRSSTTRSVSPSQHGTTRQAIAFRALASWRCKPAYTGTRSARSTDNWKPMASLKPWLAPASTCVTSRSRGKSRRRRRSATEE